MPSDRGSHQIHEDIQSRRRRRLAIYDSERQAACLDAMHARRQYRPSETLLPPLHL